MTGANATRKTILVVDDAPENLDLMKGVLGPYYRLQIATNGRLALKIALSEHPPDLILLDVMMPGMDGYEACRYLKADDRTCDIPILFVTAKSSTEDETHGLSLGAADYLTKPISPPIVLARVKTHLTINDRRKLLADQVEQRTQQLKQRSLELDETRLEVIRQLGRAAEYRDNETGMHVIRMSRYVKLLALHAGLSEPEAEQMMYAAMMHDIGKIGVPDHILLKPGKLTADEFAIIKTHCLTGYEIIGQQNSALLQLGGLIAYTHHEKWNGKGYPQGLIGAAIPFAGRITAICDVFDALTSSRPYKQAWSTDKSLELITNEAGAHFDPDLVPIFISLVPKILAIMEECQGN